MNWLNTKVLAPVSVAILPIMPGGACNFLPATLIFSETGILNDQYVGRVTNTGKR